MARMNQEQSEDMRTALTALLPLVLFAALLVTCAQPYGSVDRDSVHELLRARRMAVTPCVPGWLLEQEDIHRLSPTELRRVREILERADVRRVHERYYRDAAQGNRGDTTSCIFYLYASNAQCLGGRVVNGRVLMDDFNLTEEEQAALYALLKPHLQQLFSSLP